MKENRTPSDYGLIEIATGFYFDMKLNKKLRVKASYVEGGGSEFKKSFVSMVLYSYVGGENRTETAEAFVNYGEAFLTPYNQIEIPSTIASVNDDRG